MEKSKQLPVAIAGYIDAFNTKDTGSFLTVFDEAAVVYDDGRTHRGKIAIKKWQEELHKTFDLTNTLVGFSQAEDGVFLVVIEGKGNFPGSPQDFNHYIKLKDNKIVELSIK